MHAAYLEERYRQTPIWKQALDFHTLKLAFSPPA